MMADHPIEDPGDHPGLVASPVQLLAVLHDILSSPPITNGERDTADAWINFDGLSIEETTFASILACARYCYQAGELQLLAPPGPNLSVVR